MLLLMGFSDGEGGGFVYGLGEKGREIGESGGDGEMLRRDGGEGIGIGEWGEGNGEGSEMVEKGWWDGGGMVGGRGGKERGRSG